MNLVEPESKGLQSHEKGLGEVKVLVTGATGFIGSWLAERLVGEGASVTVLVRPNSPRRNCIRTFEKKMRVIIGDVRNEEVIRRSVKDQEAIFHLAAITQVLDSLRNPEETFSVNLNGTLNLLEILRKNNYEGVLIYASTDKVYGEPLELPIREEHPLFGKSPYDASKIAAEHTCYAYFKTYGLPVGISRSTNVYGGRDLNFQRAVPDFVSSVLLGERVTVRGSGRNIRDFMYSDDAIDGLVRMATNFNHVKGEAFNFGTGQPTNVADLAGIVAKFGRSEGFDVRGMDTRAEIDSQWVDNTKARLKLGWQPKVALLEGLRYTIDWYSVNKDLWLSMRRARAA